MTQNNLLTHDSLIICSKMKLSRIPHKVTTVAIATEKINSKRNWMKNPKNSIHHYTLKITFNLHIKYNSES